MKAFKCLSVLIIILASVLKVEATVYYSRTSGNWNASGSWSTVTYGSATNSGTYPQSADSVYIGDTHTITVNNTSSCAYMSIGQGSSGIVTFNTSANRTLTISGDLLVNANAKIWYNGNATRAHTLNIGGDITNNGTVDLYSDFNDVVNLNLNTAVNTIISGSGIWDLNTVTMNKSSVAVILDVQVSAFETAIRTFTPTAGNYIHDNSGTFDCNPSLNFTIPDPVEIDIPMGGMNFASNANYLYLQGSLILSGGNCLIGSSTGTQGIRTDQNSTNVPLLWISSGTMTINGGITYRNISFTEPFYFKMTGGSLNIECGTIGSANEALKVTDVAGSVFEMSAGIITFQKPNATGGALIDVDICGTIGAVYSTGGTMVFGNSSTPASSVFNFKPYIAATYPNMEVANANSSLKPSPSSPSTANYRFLSLQIDPGATYDNRSMSGTTGDGKHMYLLGSHGGVAFQNDGTFLARTGSVILADDTLQHIGGLSATTFYDFEMANPAGAVQEAPFTISNSITLTSGILFTTPVDLLTLSAGASAPVGSSSSYVDGPMVRTLASSSSSTVNFPIGANGDWRPIVLLLKHSSATSVTYWGQIVNVPAASLPYTLPATLSSVSQVRYYQFVRQNVANFQNATFKIYYGSDDGVTDPSSLRVAQAISTAWADEGGSGSAAGTGTITSTSFTSFNSIFALANSTGGANPLPVKWLSFDAVRKESENLLSWSTASEINNDRFEIQRSTDGLEFSTIGMVRGAGNSSTRNDYEYTDDISFAGVIFYRIAQIDFNGTISFSEIKSIYHNHDPIVLFPNVSDGSSVKLKFTGSECMKVEVNVYSSSGRKICSRQMDRMTQNVFDDGENLDAGQYYAVIDGKGLHEVLPFLIVR